MAHNYICKFLYKESKQMNINNLKDNLLLYAITDRTWLNGDTLDSHVENALRGGITMLQLREKKLEREEILKEAVRMRELCHRYDVPLIINDDVELALEADADGVHVGQSDMAAGLARKRLGKGKILGVSARTVELALEAEKNGADYLGVGAVFGTNTKNDAKKLDHSVLENICDSVKIPIVAIGGITADNMHELKGRGMNGFAVVSAVFAQKDIENAVIKLKTIAEDTIR